MLISARQKAWLQPEVMPTSPGGDRRAVEAREVRGVVLAQRRQAEDRRVAVHRRIEQQLAEMPAQLHRRRIARHRLAEIDQRPVGREGAVQHPALGLADRRGLDGGEPGIGRRNLLHLAQCMPSAAIDFTVFSRTKFAPRYPALSVGGRSIRVSSDAVKPVFRKTLRLENTLPDPWLVPSIRKAPSEGQKKGYRRKNGIEKSKPSPLCGEYSCRFDGAGRRAVRARRLCRRQAVARPVGPLGARRQQGHRRR